MLGLQIHTKDGIVMKDRVWGRERNMDDIQDGLQYFLSLIKNDDLAFEEYFYPLSSSCGSKVAQFYFIVQSRFLGLVLTLNH